MAESGCLKDGHFHNLQVENTTTADFGTALIRCYRRNGCNIQTI